MKPETNFKRSIYRLLPANWPASPLHRQSNTYGLSNGTPDDYFDGPDGDLWVEWKWLPSMPYNGRVVGTYSALQLRWLERRHHNGGNAIGVVGLKNGKAIIQECPDGWLLGSSVDVAVDKQTVARYILARCYKGAN